MNSERIIPTKALWQIAFRPFFLFGTFYSVIAIYLWINFYAGRFAVSNYYSLVNWHAHEMIFGFATAIVTGFIFTSSANWTGKKPLGGFKLQLLFSFWALARIMSFFVQGPSLVVSFIDLAYCPLLIYYLYYYLGTKEQRKNSIFLILFGLVFLGNLAVHLEIFGLASNISREGILFAMGAILMMIVIISGRVFPFFTKRAIMGANAESKEWIEKYVYYFSLAFILSNSVFETTILNSLVCLILTYLHIERYRNWHPLQTRKVPVLWILFAGYFWFIVGFFVKGISYFISLPMSLSTHLLTLGAISTIIYGMITRVSLGHTGRPIIPNKITVFCYYIINLAVVIRVFIPIFMPTFINLAITISGILWIISFGVFFIRHWKMLVSPRPDASGH